MSMRPIGMSLDQGMTALRDENERLRLALAYYARPRTFGKGEHSVFIDDSGVAKTALAARPQDGEQ